MATSTHEEQLYKIFNNVNDWLKFAEAKNFGLLSLNAAIVFGFSQTNFEDVSIIKNVGFYLFAPFAIVSFFITLISLFPILSKIEKGAYWNAKGIVNKFCNLIDKEVKFENIHFYGYLKDIKESEFEAKYFEKIGSTDTFSQFEKELVTQILYNSRITWLKYQLFKMGAFFFLIGMLLFILTIFLVAIIRLF